MFERDHCGLVLPPLLSELRAGSSKAATEQRPALHTPSTPHPPNLWPHHPRICPTGAVIYGFNTSGGGIQQTWSTQVGCGGRPAALRSRPGFGHI